MYLVLPMFCAGVGFVVFAVIYSSINSKPLTEQQKQFAAIIAEYRDSYNAADDLAKPTYQPQRVMPFAICSMATCQWRTGTGTSRSFGTRPMAGQDSPSGSDRRGCA
jgi:hypothetical protein